METLHSSSADRRLRVVTAHLQTPGSTLQPAPTSAAQGEGFGISTNDEVKDALKTGKPIVALESTIITHGMPYPQNLHTAQEVENVVRAAGAVPATIAILDGAPRVGLTASEMERLAKLGHQVTKTSRRDLPAVMAKGLNGSTTVSATMLLAHRAGIRVFVTGGIGGVHRGGEVTMDISADLTELGRTPVCVVCAGAKSVLDIPRTLEYLETQGVCVASYRTDEFPAFFTPHSGCRAPSRVNSPEEAAGLIKAALQMQLGSGIVLGVPIPDKYLTAAAPVTKATDQALKELEEQGVKGNDVTPFLLKRVQELSGGLSLDSNIALIKHNAEVGAGIAVALGSL
ncbi:hypothetical protein CYMTET_50146 [Cymbomonas tetramitiformis]|uniref:Pseudouridine-5'-phosphate glycosidase n=1 Tax=Cymbomonas tetramitiformis TaxID=36881 RepID=A0AAE0ETZ5_9CHLO|nr:hypothetical protein CYMTET_50146 [Cymbomonas tetramitiformis]